MLVHEEPKEAHECPFMDTVRVTRNLEGYWESNGRFEVIKIENAGSHMTLDAFCPLQDHPSYLVVNLNSSIRKSVCTEAQSHSVAIAYRTDDVHCIVIIVSLE